MRSRHASKTRASQGAESPVDGSVLYQTVGVPGEVMREEHLHARSRVMSGCYV